jgi:hypothetical protein
VYDIYKNNGDIEVNIKLITAAPDLYEALQMFLEVINRTPTALEHYGDAIIKAEFAIHKATSLLIQNSK